MSRTGFEPLVKFIKLLYGLDSILSRHNGALLNGHCFERRYINSEIQCNIVLSCLYVSHRHMLPDSCVRFLHTFIVHGCYSIITLSRSICMAFPLVES